LYQDTLQEAAVLAHDSTALPAASPLFWFVTGSSLSTAYSVAFFLLDHSRGLYGERFQLGISDNGEVFRTGNPDV
jgi:hypothetical protein